MKVHDAMSRDTELASPEDTLKIAAKKMRLCGGGILPVAEGDRLVGIVTDRDIVVRCIAEGKGPDTKVREAMTRDVKYCFEDDEVEAVCRNMSDIQVRRLPVMNRQKRLVGIVSLGDLTQEQPKAAMALHGITQHSGQHPRTHKH